MHIEDAKKEVVLKYIEQLEQEFSFAREDTIELLQARSSSYVPLGVFATRQLSCLQALVAYLKENQKYSFSKISRLLNRDNRTIWTSYQQAKKRRKKLLVLPEKSREYIPISIFSNRRLSVLENITSFLKKKDYSTKEISQLLLRKPTTISTVLGRATKKGSEKE